MTSFGDFVPNHPADVPAELRAEAQGGLVRWATDSAEAAARSQENVAAGSTNGTRPDLRLLPVRIEDESAAVVVHTDERWSPFTFLLDYEPNEPWSEYVRRLRSTQRGADLRPGTVPASFLLAWVGGELVGRTSIRHELNERLQVVGGHIGYGVVPDHRQRGYATEILRQSVSIVRAFGVTDILVTCDENNTGSARTIERCGGILESIIYQPEGGPRKRRYWIR